jgi:D-alanine-D-alanine ligase
MRVVVLLPPRPADARPDQDDTFVQAEEVGACLKALGHVVSTAEYADDGEATARAIADLAPDVVVNLVEEVPEGPDQLHLVTALLDRTGLRYTGAGTETLAALGDKRAMKQRLAAAGLPTAPTLDSAPPGTAFIVKSAVEHASVGLDRASVVIGAPAARRLIAEKTASFGGSWFAETYVEGREFDVSMVETPGGPMVFPVAEIRFTDHEGRPKIYSYASKWEEETDDFESTPRIFPAREEPLFSELDRLALAAWHEFGISGCCHVEFRVAEDGRPFILEVNANPCLTRDAGYMVSAAEGGMTQTDIVAAMLALA